ncbi:hypothetical protein [Flavobacterium selenitireducens]|uniref:hypothetical protein n=1 Tax=Flavobacterium selenitireducens TaxID=2722704 RepID=UPI00168B3F29|nr:hypothetical protein [Flavobacterium selenitireducens]MBD3582103.1 hypothetical protein [Flavobacterium selenitireducens]
MKKIFTLAVLCVGFASIAQECPKRLVCGQPGTFESRDGMTYNEDTKVMVMLKADYSDEKITICQADKITFDTTTKEMVVENAQRLEFFGVISSEVPIDKRDYYPKLRYTIGGGTAYLE